MAQQLGNIISSTWLTPTEIVKYNAGSSPTEMDNAFMFIGTSTTDSSGIATFQLTDDGTSGGDVLFSTIHTIVVSAELNTGTLTNVPLSSVKQLSSGKTLTVNVVESAGILVGGQGLEFDGVDTVVNVVVIGEKATSSLLNEQSQWSLNKLIKVLQDKEVI